MPLEHTHAGINPKKACDLIASSSRNHELCHPLLNGLKAGVGSNCILECRLLPKNAHRTNNVSHAECVCFCSSLSTRVITQQWIDDRVHHCGAPSSLGTGSSFRAALSLDERSLMLRAPSLLWVELRAPCLPVFRRNL